jgi:dephospho-CoA kinase
MLLVGLTGNYGMGKTHVLSEFRMLGATTLESDRIVSSLLKERNVMLKVIGIFGEDVVNDKYKLDKKKIASKVFSDNLLRRKLEELLHPLVIKKISDEIKKIKMKKSVVLVEIPLLFEGGYQDQFQKIIVVYAPKKTTFERLKRKGITKKEAVSRIRTQMPISVKKQKADYLINNGGTKNMTKKKVEKIYRSLIEEIKS